MVSLSYIYARVPRGKSPIASGGAFLFVKLRKRIVQLVIQWQVLAVLIKGLCSRNGSNKQFNRLKLSTPQHDDDDDETTEGGINSEPTTR
jgi:hypothetical protein